jgi:hypothetical protein
MEKLQMLKYAIRRGVDLNFTDGLDWTQELIEIEETQKLQPFVELRSFERGLAIEEDDGDEDWEDLKDDEDEDKDAEDEEAEEEEEEEDDEDIE